MTSISERSRHLLFDDHFRGLKDWVIQKTGLSYYQDKDRDLAIALDRCFINEPALTASDIFHRVQRHKADMDALVEELTIGETFFFRHLEMFHALRDYVFPDILRRKAASRTLRIWSAGCSIGAEPYSIAILLRELLAEQFKDWSIEILGTDINRRFLKIAQAGAYDPWALRSLPPHMLQHCFVKQDTKWQLADHCRQGVRFREHNLASDPFPNAAQDLYDFDLIICRNVMIYFDQPAIRRLVNQFYQTLTPGGWLAVGHAEPHTEIFRSFRTINAPGAVLYQRREAHETEATDHPQSIFTPTPLVLRTLRATPLPYQSASATKGLAPLPDIKKSALPAVSTHTLEQVIALADAGNVAQALDLAEKLTVQDPLNAEAQFYSGLLHFQSDGEEKAILALQRCLYLNRELALAHYYLGLASQKLGKDGHRSFRNALRILASELEDSLVPMGHGLTVHELRSLLTLSLPTTDE